MYRPASSVVTEVFHEMTMAVPSPTTVRPIAGGGSLARYGILDSVPGLALGDGCAGLVDTWYRRSASVAA